MLLISSMLVITLITVFLLFLQHFLVLNKLVYDNSYFYHFIHKNVEKSKEQNQNKNILRDK